MKLAKFLRMEGRLGQRELAELAGTTQPILSAWENGKGTMPKAKRAVVLAHLRRTPVGREWRPKLDELDMDVVEFLRAKLGR